MVATLCGTGSLVNMGAAVPMTICKTAPTRWSGTNPHKGAQQTSVTTGISSLWTLKLTVRSFSQNIMPCFPAACGGETWHHGRETRFETRLCHSDRWPVLAVLYSVSRARHSALSASPAPPPHGVAAANGPFSLQVERGNSTYGIAVHMATSPKASTAVHSIGVSKEILLRFSIPRLQRRKHRYHQSPHLRRQRFCQCRALCPKLLG